MTKIIKSPKNQKCNLFSKLKRLHGYTLYNHCTATDTEFLTPKIQKRNSLILRV